MADTRAPDLLRFGVDTLHTSHQDALMAMGLLHDMVSTGAYDPIPQKPGRVA
ncbi:hypothetical protein [Streptomyces sp. NPDC058374]|uniref:hypothetical protein n=1 Tax=Streptomyces sp. NPDC058374 TaxID=3346466 RepID=UPI00365C6DE6